MTLETQNASSFCFRLLNYLLSLWPLLESVRDEFQVHAVSTQSGQEQPRGAQGKTFATGWQQHPRYHVCPGPAGDGSFASHPLGSHRVRA